MSSELIKRIISSIILFLFSIFVIVKGGIIFNLFVLIILFISIYEWKKISYKKLFFNFGIFFLVFAFYSIYKIRNDFNGEYLHLLFVLIICISTDIGGFIFGRVLKGPKLTKISPKKTYSGVLGSYLFSLISIYIFANNFLHENININLFKIILFTLLISTISQLGDILVSLFKRLSNLKDTGTIIPGHGGVLDRIDGMIFAFPFSFLLFNFSILQL
ncbi:phosphatidate cytidylyltransferase [Candidatus Pelagibacter sp.]|uniref:phosphatidate cytidylyltransferase n=1 Tax=Candidatus Pelagibacter sp. TaxID=2024849 RepID=UPI003F828ECD